RGCAGGALLAPAVAYCPLCAGRRDFAGLLCDGRAPPERLPAELRLTLFEWPLWAAAATCGYSGWLCSTEIAFRVSRSICRSCSRSSPLQNDPALPVPPAPHALGVPS